ncbi:hypothetical protein OVA07_07485 [Novosphingobium sp. SL115]|uniref:hypothetical protein n=1 Tax=Novosphingobium sp. SL115 TaxID=2995150 RepID=UPI0022754850|nr:hypothetical protein [Novosphingobium sp. SL115]MCY1670857.1 hypothetical protein [Novosphingobium sp. SL115]
MSADRRTVLTGLVSLAALPAIARAAPAPFHLDTPMAAPRWATMQRDLLAAHTAACEDYYQRYVDKNDALECFVRWGANDGPDDAAEFTNDWVLLHALGASDRLLTLSQRFWEGHLRQYGRARTRDVPVARRGMYHRDFPAQMDWQHNAEGLSTFNVMGLSAPDDPRLALRTRMFADLYTGRDRSVGNYDPKARVIRSLMNGSRGPLLRTATPLDWAGDPFDASRFHLEHGEDDYAQFLAHYAEYTDVVGDNPLNLQATTLGLNAYALGLGDRFRQWALDYFDAWASRARANGDILPSKVGLDGKAAPDWWGGTYGWNFSPVVPQTGAREHRNRVPRSITAFYNALLLSGDMEYMHLWRRQTQRINNAACMVDGALSAPTMYGPDGWHGWKAGPYRTSAFEIWYATQDPQDREIAGDDPWIAFIEGRNPGYAEEVLSADRQRLNARVAAYRADTSTPETRLADWTLDFNPASAKALVQTMTGGLHIARPTWSRTSPPQGGVPLHCRLRYFDPARRRAGIPEDVAALVHGMTDRETRVTLVNLGTAPRDVVVQGGAFGEHRIDAVMQGSVRRDVAARSFAVTLSPGCGADLTLAMTRYANRPCLSLPWKR